jgi:hypothetical protein
MNFTKNAISFRKLPKLHQEILREHVFTKAAAARIYGIVVSDIESIEVWDKVIFVQFRHRRPLFTAQMPFILDIHSSRVSRVLNQRNLRTVYQDDRVIVENHKDWGEVSQYVISSKDNVCTCTCKDFQMISSPGFVAAVSHWLPDFIPYCKHTYYYLGGAFPIDCLKNFKVERKQALAV